MADDFDEWIAERNRIMSEFDVEAGMKMMGCADRMVAVMGLHKARYECLAIDERDDADAALSCLAMGETAERRVPAREGAGTFDLECEERGGRRRRGWHEWLECSAVPRHRLPSPHPAEKAQNSPPYPSPSPYPPPYPSPNPYPNPSPDPDPYPPPYPDPYPCPYPALAAVLATVNLRLGPGSDGGRCQFGHGRDLAQRDLVDLRPDAGSLVGAAGGEAHEAANLLGPIDAVAGALEDDGVARRVLGVAEENTAILGRHQDGPLGWMHVGLSPLKRRPVICVDQLTII